MVCPIKLHQHPLIQQGKVENEPAHLELELELPAVALQSSPK
jgi:hypothetical protein